MPDCPFCDRIEASEFDAHYMAGFDCVVFEPLSPVTPGHRLVVPVHHVEHEDTDAPLAVGSAMEVASMIAQQLSSYNLITSCGRPATQSVPHIHVHVVPRRLNDGLALPWYSGKSKKGH